MLEELDTGDILLLLILLFLFRKIFAGFFFPQVEDCGKKERILSADSFGNVVSTFRF